MYCQLVHDIRCSATLTVNAAKHSPSPIVLLIMEHGTSPIVLLISRTSGKPCCWQPPCQLDVTGLVEHWGYSLEYYEVQTHDGYLLGLYRIPSGKHDSSTRLDDIGVRWAHTPLVCTALAAACCSCQAVKHNEHDAWHITIATCVHPEGGQAYPLRAVKSIIDIFLHGKVRWLSKRMVVARIVLCVGCSH